MKVHIEKSIAKGRISAPPSKSFAHRLIIGASLAGKNSRVNGISESEDILATLDSAKECFNAEYKKDGDGIVFTSSDIFGAAKSPLLCRESGSTMRFFIPLCLLKSTPCRLCGSERLLSRPLGVYEDICAEQKLLFSKDETGVTVCGPLKAGKFTVRGDVSSQFITGLIFALPLLGDDSEISIIPPLDSRPYINITLEALRNFGVFAEWRDKYTLFVKGSQKYKPADVSVEGDFSNAAFLSALSVVGGDVDVTGLSENSAQGDSAYIGFFRLLSEKIPTIDISDCPDLAPILMSVAAAKNGVTLTGTRRLKIKESDRGDAMAEELSKFSVPVRVADDYITVEGGCLKAPVSELDSHNDHRIAMSLAVLSTLTGGVINGAEAVKKSYPNFFDDIKKLGIEVTEIGN